MARRPTLGARMRYWFDNVMARGTGALIALLALATGVMIVAGGAIVWAFQLSPAGGESPGAAETLWGNLMRALDPGTVAGDEGWVWRAVMIAITVGGLFVLASLISIISGAFDAKVEQLRKGTSTVIETGHTVILGWNSKVVSIISELTIANESERRATIVVLADRDKVEMEDEIREHVPDARGTRIVCRSGDPLDPSDLLRAAPFDAKSIIVLGDEDSDDPDSRSIKTTLALTNHPERTEAPLHIVAQIRNAANMEVARLVGGGEAKWILAAEKIGQITAQTSLQPGLSEVYSELLQFEGDEIYFTRQPALTGATYAEAQLAFSDSCLVGIEHDGAITLNPPPATAIADGDWLVVVAEDDSTIEVDEPAAPDAESLREEPAPTEAPDRTLVIGFSSRLPELLVELDQYVENGSVVTILSEQPVSGLLPLAHSSVEVVEGSGARRADLDSVDAASYDHVVVVAYRDHLDIQDADARTLVTLLHLRDIMESTDRTINVVSEMLDDRNRKLAEVTRADDFIVSDHLISLLISQVSENPKMADLYDTLFAADGAEVYLRPAEWYVDLDVEVDFYTVCAGAQLRGETAFGYVLAKGPDGRHDMHVNPGKRAKRTYRAGDRIVVLAED